MAKKNVDARNSMFGRLAMESGLVTHDEIVACIEEQERIRAEGAVPPRLGEMLVEREIISADEVEAILRMQSNPGGLIGRQLVENGLVTRDQLRECLDEQAEYHRTGRVPPRLGEMVVAKGWVKQEDLNQLLRKKVAPGSLFGEFLVANKLVREEDLNKCLERQKTTLGKDGKPVRLGDMLVICGVLRKEQVELYLQRHLQGRKTFSAATAPVVAVPKRSDTRTVVRGDLMILDNLGQHVDGVTYKAVHVPSAAIVAAHFFTDAEPEGFMAETFETKVEQSTKVRHPAVQPLFSSEMVNNRRVLVAEYIEGVTLDQILGEQGKIEWTWALEILNDFSEALAQSSALGIIHDDIRPGSIIVDYAGRARLGLWAYTRDPLANREWVAKRHKKVAFYHAPERYRKPPSERADIFSLGMTLIHAITGISILNGGSFAEALKTSTPADAVQNLAIDMTLPLEFVSILARMVEANPANRFASFHDLHTAVTAFRVEQGLDVTLSRTTVLAGSKMNADEASAIVNQFLETERTVSTIDKVSITRLVRFYTGPIVAMLIIMLATTAVYRTTQSSHGLMVRANWRDLQGDKAGALQLYRIISTLYPTNETVQRRYYDLALEVGDHGEAEIALERLMPFHPDKHLEYLELQADLQVWQSRFLSAVDLYRNILASKPYDLALRTKMANALLWAQNYPDAQKEFTDLVSLDPTNNVLILGLARAAAGNKDVDTASQMFDQLNRQGVLSQDAFMEYAWMLHDANRMDKLKELAETALHRKETEDWRVANLTYLNLWAGDYAEAGKMLDRQSVLDRDSREFLEMRITINDHLGNTDGVIEDYKALAQLDPNDPEPLLIVAGHYQGRNDFRDADTYLRQALNRSGGNDEDIKLAIARNLSFMRDYTEAERWYRDILATNASSQPAIRGLVEALLETDKYAEAQTYAERLYRENPGDRQSRVNLALVYTWLGKMDEAYPLIDVLLKENLLTNDERDLLAVNAMRSGANDLLLRIIGASEGDSEKLTEYRLILARRLRGEGKFATALPLYAAVLSATPNPDTSLLMEMAETANWAGRHDIAVQWLEIARDIAARREQRSGYATTGTSVPPQRFRLSPDTWDSLLEPLRREPEIYEALSGFRRRYSGDATTGAKGTSL